MSDYPNPNIHRSGGITARGILVTLGVLAIVFFMLAVLGANTRGSSPVLPAAETSSTSSGAETTTQPVAPATGE